jgi:1,2-diacylglycerol 3-alpha-glucosyltransferase
MRIAFFSDTYVPQVNGLVTSILTSREELEKLGHEVLVFAPTIPGIQNEKNVYFLGGFPYYPQPEYTFVLPWGKNFNLAKFKDLKVDLIHSHAMFGSGLVAAGVAKLQKLPLVMTYHTLFEQYLHYFPLPKAILFSVNKHLTRLMCDRCKLVIAPTQAIKDVLTGYGTKARIEVLPTGLSRDPFMRSGARKSDFNVPEDAFLFSSAGRLGREKNFDVLFRALASLKDKLPKWRLLVAGDGPERKNLEALLVSLGINENVSLIGYVSREKVLNLVEASELFTFASVSETQGMVILESMARGTPVIAADAMGPGQMMKGDRGGWLAKPGDAEDLAAKILAAVQDERARAAKAADARNLARDYAAEAINAKLAGFYEEVLKAS